ncbi:phosphonate ABC transporter substrate-binding protein [Vreelandella jeotgali]|uniref:phosphonate ABC transporter substrate-binding protein n=1 Tax=Vreelandella jeotgali TaxID=553386 RepID=UPI00034B41F0|nr:phosphonate ABC transporter substrate-binding protein [Halomonas jeotgali]
MLTLPLRRLALSLIIGLGVISGPAAAEEPLKFGIISTESSQNMAPLWKPFLADLSEEVGVEVKPFFATDYAAVIQAMRFDKIDLAWYGNKSAMEAVDRAGGEIFAQTVPDNGKAGYYSLLLVSQDSPYDSVDEVLANASDLIFGNGDPNSTSGFLVPGYYVFAQNGVDPSRAFKRTLNSNHETNALAVANGQVDVATNNTESMDRLEQSHPGKAEQIKSIWKSPLIPSDPLVWRKELPEETKAKLKEFFFNYGDTQEEKAILAGLQWSGLKPSDNDQLLPIRQLELFKQRSQIANDDSQDEQQKKQRLAELDERLEELSQRIEKQNASSVAAQ